MSHYDVAVFSRSPSDVDRLLAPFNECVEYGSAFAEFEEDETADLDESTGKRGRWYNPNAHWDWYGVGGRWSGRLKLKEGGTGLHGTPSWINKEKEPDPVRCDQALVSDCDFSPDPTAYERALREWAISVEGLAPHEGENADRYRLFYKPVYYIERYSTKEKYAVSQSRFGTFAFVTADGEWHESGHMGWFGIDDVTDKSRCAYDALFANYLRNAETKGLYITIVDCHI